MAKLMHELTCLCARSLTTWDIARFAQQSEGLQAEMKSSQRVKCDIAKCKLLVQQQTCFASMRSLVALNTSCADAVTAQAPATVMPAVLSTVRPTLISRSSS